MLFLMEDEYSVYPQITKGLGVESVHCCLCFIAVLEVSDQLREHIVVRYWAKCPHSTLYLVKVLVLWAIVEFSCEEYLNYWLTELIIKDISQKLFKFGSIEAAHFQREKYRNWSEINDFRFEIMSLKMFEKLLFDLL